MTQEEKAKAYDKAIERAKSLIGDTIIEESGQHIAEVIFPELKESEDERIRKELIFYLGDMPEDTELRNGVTNRDVLAWLEKQDDSPIKWNKNTKDCKPKVSHSVLMKTTHGIAEGEWQGEHWHQYRWAGLVRDADVLSWMELSNLEKQGEQKPTIEMKSAEESLGIDSDTYNEIVDECIYGEQKPADTVEQKCEESKTKVFDAPTPFEDKLYAFVLACEILVDPSKREFILEHSQEILDAAREQIGKEQKPAWSEEDDDDAWMNDIISKVENNLQLNKAEIDWLKSLRPQNTWKPSDEQMADLWNMLCECRPADHQLLQDIYYGLKKLREE